MDKNIQTLLYLQHQAHSVFIDGNLIMPTNYLVGESNILSLLQSRLQEQPSDTFITFYDAEGKAQSLSYQAFIKKCFQTANYLKAQGLIEEDRIATVSHNHLETVIQYFGAWCAGMTVVPINVGETPQRIQYILENAGVKLAFVRDEYLPMIQSLNYEMKIVKASDFQIVIAEHSDEFFQNSVTDTRKQISTTDPRSTLADLETEALIVYTSGTFNNDGINGARFDFYIVDATDVTIERLHSFCLKSNLSHNLYKSCLIIHTFMRKSDKGGKHFFKS
jgi:non-ribosomal peptide synthetase component E (peptide arylation enzyme)